MNIKDIYYKYRYKRKRFLERCLYPLDFLKQNSKKFVYLKACHGGLGDALQFSTLPEEFFKQKGKLTYILKSSSFRNPEIYDLVWGVNPYVVGIQEGPWQAGDPLGISNQNIYNNMIQNIEHAHGLEPKNHYPNIYYKPKKIKTLSNSFAVDLNSVSVKYEPEIVKSEILKIKEIHPDKKFLYINFKNDNRKVPLDRAIYSDYLLINNIFEYCDIINSLYGYIAYASGGSHLSSAIKGSFGKLKSYSLIDEKVYEFQKRNERFLFQNIKYIKMKKSIKFWNLY